MSHPVSIVENLRLSAIYYPDRPAIVVGHCPVSYAELWQRAQAVATFLHEHGLRPADRVAIALENSADYVAIYYGILAAGGIAVALNATAKQRDFSHWLAHSESTFLFGSAGNQELTAAIAVATGAALKFVDTDQSVMVATGGGTRPALPQAHAAPICAATPACLIYTSGTTGAPKGVLLSHGNLASNTAAIVEYLGLRADDSIVSVLPFYYSYGSSVLHSHIAVGGSVILQENLVYPHLVIETLARQRATGFAGVPSTFALLLSRVSLSNYDLGALRYFTQAGGPMAPAMTQRLRAALPHSLLYIMYGQTEATARLSYLPPDRLDAKPGSVGIAIPGVEIQVRAEDGAASPPGQTGHVWARGANIMLGYWRNEEASQAVLRDGWLHTGDMGYQDNDGYLYLVGRRSDMIKTGAHRVHPLEVEEVIAELEWVAEVAVVGIDDDTLGQVIKAVVVLRPGAAVDAQAIKHHCRARLANYKIPKHVEFRLSLARTPSGKIKRNALQ